MNKKKRQTKKVHKKRSGKDKTTTRKTQKLWERKALLAIKVLSCLILVFVAVLWADYFNQQSKRPILMPEYKRTLKQVIFSLSITDENLSLHHNLFSLLPEYTKIFVLLPKNNLDNIRSQLKNKPYWQNIILIPFDTKKMNGPEYACLNQGKKDLGRIKLDNEESVLFPKGSLWAQDTFEPLVSPEGNTQILFSLIHRCFLISGMDLIPDNSYIKLLSSIGFEVKQVPFHFHGGNILVGEVKEKRIAFMGLDFLRRNNAIRKVLTQEIPSNQEIKYIVQEKFGVDEIVFIGKGNQPKHMFHLDQAMIFLEDGYVAVSRIIGKNPKLPEDLALVQEAKSFLIEARKALRSLGFKILDINMTASNLLKYEHYVNSIPYTDATTGQKTMLMPIFTASQSIEDKEIIKKNTAVFQSTGFEVIKVPVETTKLRGGIHCLVNVLE